MDDLDAIERELDVAREHDDNVARVRLIPKALALPAAEPFRAEYLDELAYAYEQLGRFDEAVDAMRKALDTGWDGELDDHPSARALIATYCCVPDAGRRRSGGGARRARTATRSTRPSGSGERLRERGPVRAGVSVAEGLSEPDELQRQAEETIWEADREDREGRPVRGLRTAEPAAPPQPH